MEDVLASIRRAIDENTYGPDPDRPGGSMAEFRVRFDAPANQETRRRRGGYEPASSSPQGFAGILSGRKGCEEANPPDDRFKSGEPVQRKPEAPHRGDDGQSLYEGYYGAQVEDYAEPAPELRPAPSPASAGRYLPLPPPAIVTHRQAPARKDGLMSEASSDATQAAFGRLAETLTRRALGERPIADVTQELLRGMLKQWLDDNLPKIVERLVREEIERVVRGPR
jgi:cell pole-organizing protein PopZ